jgi:hypothetical protein
MRLVSIAPHKRFTNLDAAVRMRSRRAALLNRENLRVASAAHDSSPLGAVPQPYRRGARLLAASGKRPIARAGQLTRDIHQELIEISAVTATRRRSEVKLRPT